MTAEAGSAAASLDRLRTARAVRDGAEQVFAEGLAGRLEHFALRLEALPGLARRVVEIARAVYPDLRTVPIHGRYRHFGVGGIDRLARLDQRLAGATATEQLCTRADLVITSVLLDAGAGAAWSYHERASGHSFDRSEGLAVASYTWFAAGGLSSDGAAPLRVNASRLRALDDETLEQAFQVRADNPLLGVPGRVAVLRALGGALERQSLYFGGDDPRPGQLAIHLVARAAGAAGALPAEEILAALLRAFGAIWPGRETLAGVPLGDVWTHSRFGRLPFHKLSQWLAYSLIEPLEQAGVRVTDTEALTGLPEYRNGGLFLDGGVLVPKDPEVLAATHTIGSDVIIEWRALTVALLDRLASEMRQQLGLTALELPLAQVLEAGTWRAGRILALEKRAGGGPPLRIVSDGTVF